MSTKDSKTEQACTTHDVSTSFSTDIIQKKICEMEVLRFNLPCENVKYLFSDWEMDVLSMNKNGYLTEYEVKVSRSDFKADAKKRSGSFMRKRLKH